MQAGSNTFASEFPWADQVRQAIWTVLYCCWPPTPAATSRVKQYSSTEAFRSVQCARCQNRAAPKRLSPAAHFAEIQQRRDWSFLCCAFLQIEMRERTQRIEWRTTAPHRR